MLKTETILKKFGWPQDTQEMESLILGCIASHDLIQLRRVMAQGMELSFLSEYDDSHFENHEVIQALNETDDAVSFDLEQEGLRIHPFDRNDSLLVDSSDDIKGDVVFTKDITTRSSFTDSYQERFSDCDDWTKSDWENHEFIQSLNETDDEESFDLEQEGMAVHAFDRNHSSLIDSSDEIKNASLLFSGPGRLPLASCPIPSEVATQSEHRYRFDRSPWLINSKDCLEPAQRCADPLLEYEDCYGTARHAMNVLNLKEAVLAGDLQKARVLMLNGITPHHSMIFDAVVKNDPHMVCLLIFFGANPNAITFLGGTVLHYAALNCPFKMVKVLLKNGADIDQPFQSNLTVKDYARHRHSPYLPENRLLLKIAIKRQSQVISSKISDKKRGSLIWA